MVCSVDKKIDGEIYQSAYYEHRRFREHPLRFFLDEEFKFFLLTQPKETVFHFHSVFIPWFLPAVKLLRKHGYSRIVLTPHGQYIDEAMMVSLKKRVFFRLFDSKVLRLVDAVQAVGRTELNAYLKDNAKQCYLIPNGCNPVDTPIIYNLSLVFGYMGRLDIKQKALDVLIKAFAFYCKQGGTGMLRLAGDGSDKEYLLSLCQQLGVMERVEFVGKVFGEEKIAFLDSNARRMVDEELNWNAIARKDIELLYGGNV